MDKDVHKLKGSPEAKNYAENFAEYYKDIQGK